MSRPSLLFQVEWEDWRGRQERRYRTAERAAQQLASILAPPDDVARLRGLWVTDGWARGARLEGALHWKRLDPATFLDEVADAAGVVGADEDGMTARDRYRLLALAWREHEQRERA